MALSRSMPLFERELGSESVSIKSRVREAGIAYGSDPWHLEDRELNAWNGGRGFYFCDPNGHLVELPTRA
jgi:hypothetical protein